MKKVWVVIMSVVMLITLSACSSANTQEETNAKSILNSVKAVVLPEDEEVNVVIKEIDLLKTQKAHNNEYSYFLVKTDKYDWGYAEFRNGEVITFNVGYSRSDAKTRCNDLAEYRISKVGGIGQ